jgi:two-component system, OmpR family, KDP operon response regulator KdpE
MIPTESDSPRLLVVEDEPANRSLVAAILSRSGQPRLRNAHLVEAASLAEARAALAAGQPDIVLLDVRLPDGSGLDLARELLARAGRPRVVILSASVMPAEREAALASGVDAFLGKPYTPTQLTDLLDVMLD